MCQQSLEQRIPRACRKADEAKALGFLFQPLVIEPAHPRAFLLRPVLRLARQIIGDDLSFIRLVDEHAAHATVVRILAKPRQRGQRRQDEIAFDHGRSIGFEVVGDHRFECRQHRFTIGDTLFVDGFWGQRAWIRVRAPEMERGLRFWGRQTFEDDLKIVHLDNADGPLIGTCDVPENTGATRYTIQTTAIKPVTGVHALVMKFVAATPDPKFPDLFHLELFAFGGTP